VASEEGLRRLRWRLRGAWQWPAYVLLTVVDGLILHALPPTGTGIGVIPGILLGAAGNLFLVAVVAPWFARRLLERQARARDAGLGPGPPYEVVLSRASTALLLAGAVGLVAAGLAARPLVVSETEATTENAAAVRAHVLGRAPAEIRRNVDSANTVRISRDFFRTCIAYDDRSRAYCVFVDTKADPPQLRRDLSQRPNYEGGPG
jgi:hypothetical protein